MPRQQRHRKMRTQFRRWWLENVLGPVHNHEQHEPCVDCWERQGLRRPTPRKARP